MSLPRWVALEGLNGVGKTYLARQLVQRLGARARLAEELTDNATDEYVKNIFGALSAPGDFFLRGGHPRTETLALLSVKTQMWEQIGRSLQPGVDVVVEDRGLDSVSVYQAAILAAGGSVREAEAHMHRINVAATAFRPHADTTILIRDDFDACMERLAQREGALLTGADVELTRTVDHLYGRMKRTNAGRFIEFDRREMSTDQIVEGMVEVCLGTRTAERNAC